MLENTIDEMAEEYFRIRGMFPINDILEMFRLNTNVIQGRLLDLGCGTGHPVCDYFLQNQWDVTGVDISASMLTIARNTLPGAHFIKGEMQEFDMGVSQYHAITAVYSLFHLEVAQQSRVFSKAYEALRPGGKFLFTYAGKDYTGHEEFSGEIEFLGRMLPYSHKREKDLLIELTELGFSIDVQAKFLKGEEKFLWFVVSR